MPQMSPMWWTCLMMMFITLFLILMTMIYFNINKITKLQIKILNKKLNWKW